MTWRNPYRRAWLADNTDPTGRPIPITGELQCVFAEDIWEDFKNDSHEDGDGRAAMRVREGSRHACARLRAQRDEARANVAAFENGPPTSIMAVADTGESDCVCSVCGRDVDEHTWEDCARGMRQDLDAPCQGCDCFRECCDAYKAELDSARADLHDLAARRAVDGELRRRHAAGRSKEYFVLVVPDGTLRLVRVDEDSVTVVDTAPDYHALATALNLKWEKDDG